MKPKAVARRMVNAVTRTIRGKAARDVRWARFYFGAMNDTLGREARAVAAGQERYLNDLTSDQPSYFLLRRNIHRLEKGLLMRPRRSSFAAGFIQETVSIYARARQAAGTAWNSELVWAEDVLTAYFSAVNDSDLNVRAARSIFVAIARGAARNDAAVPYRRDLDRPAPVNFDAFMALSRRRRSVRWYEDRPVSREVIDRALEAAAQAPSACNRQPFRFQIFDTSEEAHRITGLAMGTKGFSDQVPAVAVLIGQLRAYPYERDRHAIYIDGSLAAMSFMFALETLGVGSCPINWPDQEPHETRIANTLALEADERVVMLISFGWPDRDALVAYSAKRPIEQLRSYGFRD